jgi:hypothetical protein
MSAHATTGRPAEQPVVGQQQTLAVILLIAAHAALLGYTTHPERLAHAVSVAATDVAAWVTAGTRHATAAALIDLSDTASCEADLLYAAGLISIRGADGRYVAGTAARFAAACDALATTGLVRYQQPTAPATARAAGNGRQTASGRPR